MAMCAAHGVMRVRAQGRAGACQFLGKGTALACMYVTAHSTATRRAARARTHAYDRPEDFTLKQLHQVLPRHT
jgi:hypothetical protein